MAKHIDPILAKDVLNKRKDANKESFSQMLFTHVPANKYLQDHDTAMVLATPNPDYTKDMLFDDTLDHLRYKDYRIGIFGVINGLIGIHGGFNEPDYRIGNFNVSHWKIQPWDSVKDSDKKKGIPSWMVISADPEVDGSGWAYCSAEVDEDGVYHRDVFTPNCLISEAEPEEGQPPKVRPEPPTEISPEFALGYLNDLLTGDPVAISALALLKFKAEEAGFGTDGSWNLTDLINDIVDINKTSKWGKIVAKISGDKVTKFEIVQ